MAHSVIVVDIRSIFFYKFFSFEEQVQIDKAYRRGLRQIGPDSLELRLDRGYTQAILAYDAHQ
jgi:hypothetical protein